VILVDPSSFETVAQVQTTAATGYPIAFTDVAPGRYILAAGTDRDGDGKIGDPGEAFGVFPDVAAPTPLDVPLTGTVTVSLPVVEQASLLAGAERGGLDRRVRPVFQIRRGQ